MLPSRMEPALVSQERGETGNLHAGRQLLVDVAVGDLV